jgi:hypothetical protein
MTSNPKPEDGKDLLGSKPQPLETTCSDKTLGPKTDSASTLKQCPHSKQNQFELEKSNKLIEV